MTLLDFWNHHEISEVFVVSTVCAGESYRNNVSEDDDYCDLNELIFAGGLFSGLSCEEIGELTGTVDGNFWEWDGKATLRDYRQNDYQRFVLFAE